MADDTYQSFHYSASDGLRLHARDYRPAGRNTALPVVCLSGLTRNAADFHDLAIHLSRHAEAPRRVVAFDYRGRGRSAWDPDWRRYDVVVETQDILAGLTALDIGHAAFIGTSRGGLIIHVIAAVRPGLLRAVVLNDVGPVVDGAGLAQIKAYLERAPQPKTMVDAVAIQRAATGQSFSALTDADWERMTRALWREVDGRPVADFDPDLVRTMQALDLTKPLPDLWPQFDGLGALPLMTIRGENSRLLSAQTLVEMGRRHPGMQAITVAGQGHAPLLETGDLPRRIAEFVARADR